MDAPDRQDVGPFASMTRQELVALVLKQRELYGRALTNVAQLLEAEGQPGLGHVVRDVQLQYGLGDPAPDVLAAPPIGRDWPTAAAIAREDAGRNDLSVTDVVRQTRDLFKHDPSREMTGVMIRASLTGQVLQGTWIKAMQWELYR